VQHQQEHDELTATTAASAAERWSKLMEDEDERLDQAKKTDTNQQDCGDGTSHPVAPQEAVAENQESEAAAQRGEKYVKMIASCYLDEKPQQKALYKVNGEPDHLHLSSDQEEHKGSEKSFNFTVRSYSDPFDKGSFHTDQIPGCQGLKLQAKEREGGNELYLMTHDDHFVLYDAEKRCARRRRPGSNTPSRNNIKIKIRSKKR
jgi:hypothetical protein